MSYNALEVQAMRLAITAARQARAAGDTPFGATLVSAQGQIVHTSPNRQNTSNDCTAHAELVLVREVMALYGASQLQGATVFASGEPCAMCSGALFWAGIARVVYAATTHDIAEALGGPSLPARCAQVLAQASPAVTVEGEMLREEALVVLKSR